MVSIIILLHAIMYYLYIVNAKYQYTSEKCMYMLCKMIPAPFLNSASLRKTNLLINSNLSKSLVL